MTRREKANWIAGIAIAILMLLGLMNNIGGYIASGAWEGCDLVLSNPTDQTVAYNVEWLDHDIEEYRGYWIARCGGELKSGDTYRLSDFLGIGRHRILWSGEQTIMQNFTVGADSTVIELSIKHW